MKNKILLTSADVVVGKGILFTDNDEIEITMPGDMVIRAWAEDGYFNPVILPTHVDHSRGVYVFDNLAGKIGYSVENGEMSDKQMPVPLGPSDYPGKMFKFSHK